MKRRIVVAIAVCVVSALPTVYAQKVVVESTKVIIDCTGMPTGAVTNTPKARTTTGTNSTAAGAGLDDIASEVNEAQVYKRFEVSKVDNSTGIAWKEAIDLCNGLNQDGTGWRTPTMRELMLMWMFKPVLEKQAGFTKFAADTYWSATEFSTTMSSFQNLDTGFCNPNQTSKTTSRRVRCIRDLVN